MTNIGTGNWYPYPDGTVFDVRKFGPDNALWNTQQQLLRKELGLTADGLGSGGGEVNSAEPPVGEVVVEPVRIFMTQKEFRARNKGIGVDHSISAVAVGGYHGS